MYLYSHIWKSFIRNERWRRNLLTKILYLFFGLYLILVFLILGYDINNILLKSGKDPVNAFNSVLIWYLAADLLIRCLLQPLPALHVVPYLRFSIRHKKIINHLLKRSMVNIFNILPLLVVVPFSLKTLVPALGLYAGLFYMTGFMMFLIFNNFSALLIEFLARKRPLFYLVPFGILAFFAILQKLDLPLTDSSVALGRSLTEGNPMALGALAAMSLSIIYTTKMILSRNLYIDEIGSRNNIHASRAFGISAFRKLGDPGRYMSLEITLLLRNKRPRQTLILVPLFLVYFFFMSLNDKGIWSPFFLMVLATMLTGFGAVSYGQLMFSWESSYFDGIIARKNNFITYLKAKYFLLSGLTTVVFIPVVIFFSVTGQIDVFFLFSILLFTIGVSSFIIMFIGTFNDGRINLGEGTFMNYQGVKGSQFLLSFIFIMLPIGIYSLFRFLFNETAGVIAIALPGLVFIIFHKWWITAIIARRFYARKYKTLEGFRKLSN